ncbi:hypothetical protein ACFELC_23680 [Pseudomonas aeruginosa]|uniref:hypothetical protein n=1 Tax=Pseudomonas aeruginosa TaxID=287 RepID=UPI00383BAA2A
MARLKDDSMCTEMSERAYDLILGALKTCETAEEQRRFIDVLLCQSAALTRILSGAERLEAVLAAVQKEDFDLVLQAEGKMRH